MLGIVVVRNVTPMNAALASLIGAVSSLLFYAFVVSTLWQPKRREATSIPISSFCMMMGVVLLGAAWAWMRPGDVSDAFFAGSLLGTLMGSWLPTRRAR